MLVCVLAGFGLCLRHGADSLTDRVAVVLIINHNAWRETDWRIGWAGLAPSRSPTTEKVAYNIINKHGLIDNHLFNRPTTEQWSTVLGPQCHQATPRNPFKTLLVAPFGFVPGSFVGRTGVCVSGGYKWLQHDTTNNKLPLWPAAAAKGCDEHGQHLHKT